MTHYGALSLDTSIGLGDQAGQASSGPIYLGSFFTGVIQSIQTDLGLQYSGVMLATGSSPPIVGLVGSTSSAPLPVRIMTGAGVLGVATYSLSLDGGSTVAQSGTTAAFVPISGLPGISVAFGSGTYVGDETYVATCSGLADQSGNGKNFVQPTSNKQPIISLGVNGFSGVLFDGVDDTLDCSTISLVAPGTTPFFRFAVLRAVTWGANKDLFGGLFASAFVWLQSTSTPIVALFNGSVQDGSNALAVGTWGACESAFTGSASDYLKMGSGAKVTGVSSGNSASAGGLQIGNFNNTAARFANFELLALVHCNNVPTAPQIAAARAAVTAKYGVTVAV